MRGVFFTKAMPFEHPLCGKGRVSLLAFSYDLVFNMSCEDLWDLGHPDALSARERGIIYRLRATSFKRAVFDYARSPGGLLSQLPTTLEKQRHVLVT